MLYPDLEMDGRPALPVMHSDWTQERETLVIFLTLVWNAFKEWQGGPTYPAWPAIAADINSGAYRTIDRQRLPEEHHPFIDPHNWNEYQTRVYSVYFRQSHNERGCALVSAFAKCFQFRMIIDEQGHALHEDTHFRTHIHPSSEINWGIAPLLFQ
ncbi:hypothetical protein FS749_010639 [Ceratobasidium sp. UAMH 11750]|nr:hypothetical protein FS749_010639 [Ceratobasidium sp. UAMH 11750]